jgi:hypothetical protein
MMMAQNADKGFVERFLQRTDGGLLTLNLTTLTLVAGLQKLGDLGAVVNLRILVGGLCVGLFAAILCAYFTEFGTRATSAASRSLNVRAPFHTDLVLGSTRQGGGILFFAMFAVWIAVSLVPGSMLWSNLKRVPDRASPEAIAAAAARDAFRLECGPGDRAELALVRSECLRDRANALANDLKCPTAAERQAYEARCETLEKKLAEAVDKEKGGREQLNAARNRLLIWSILFYLSLPLLGWLFGVLYAGAANRAAASRRWRSGLTFEPDSVEEGPPPFPAKATLGLQIDAIQSLRLAAAMISLAAFMIGVGLALVNTGVTNFQSGFSETSASVPAPAANGGRGGSASASASGTANALGGESLSQGGSASGGLVTGPTVNIPDKITLDLNYGESGRQPQSVVLEGLDRLDVRPEFHLPPAVTHQPINVLPAPTPTTPAPPPTPDEIAGALEKRVTVRTCVWAWDFPPRRCSYKLGPEPASPKDNR